MTRTLPLLRGRASSLTLAAALLTLAGCGSSGPKGTILPSPPDFVGFPEVGRVDQVELTASVPEDGRELASPSVDRTLRFIEEQGLIPIEVALYRDADSASDVTVREIDMDFRLFLADGTVLSVATPSSVEEGIKRPYELEDFQALRFQTGSVDPKGVEDGKCRGLVFFRQPAPPVKWTGTTRFQFERDGYLRSVDLQHALLSVNFMREGVLRTVATGIQLGQ